MMESIDGRYSKGSLLLVDCENLHFSACTFSAFSLLLDFPKFHRL